MNHHGFTDRDDEVSNLQYDEFKASSTIGDTNKQPRHFCSCCHWKLIYFILSLNAEQKQRLWMYLTMGNCKHMEALLLLVVAFIQDKRRAAASRIIPLTGQSRVRNAGFHLRKPVYFNVLFYLYLTLQPLTICSIFYFFLFYYCYKICVLQVFCYTLINMFRYNCYIQMSQENIKQKKPYLKKGTRQFLSNAQIRSQSSKSKIVDFGNEQQSPSYQPKLIKNQSSEEQIKIKTKPPIAKTIPNEKRNTINKRIDKIETPNQNSFNKPKRESSIGKRKEAALSDYLDNQSAVAEAVQKKSNKTREEEPIPPPKPKPQKKREDTDKKLYTQNSAIKAVNLVQQEDEEQPNHRFIDNDNFRPIANPLRNRQSSRPAKQKSVNKRTKENKPEKDIEEPNHCEVNFVSDKSDDEENQPRFRRKMNNDHSEQHRKQNIIENQPRSSKVKMNYFNNHQKGEKTKQIVSQPDNRQKQQKKQLTISDIPKQLKEMIVNETIAAKQQQMFQTLMKIKQKQESLKKEKEKLQEEQKGLSKIREQFEREMQQKNKQFEEKLKAENTKLTREKKYMKEVQMQGKGDWKIKTQLEETKKNMELMREDKKKMESKLKTEIENLRKKLEEETRKNKLLTEQLRLLQYGQLMQKQQIKQFTKQQKKNAIQQQKALQWADAPNFSYLNRVLEESFSLIGIEMANFQYDYNEYYQYYLKVKDEHCPLETQSEDPDRAKRVYKNGKIEHEYFQKFIKEIFPFNYTVVHLWNGDVKQILPSGIQIYYSKNSGVTQITSKQNGSAKEICFFPNNDTAQMTVVYDGDAAKNVTEVFCNGHLKRMLADGSVVLQKKDGRGNIMKIPINS